MAQIEGTFAYSLMRPPIVFKKKLFPGGFITPKPEDVRAGVKYTEGVEPRTGTMVAGGETPDAKPNEYWS